MSLRSALAALKSPVMTASQEAAKNGVKVVPVATEKASGHVWTDDQRQAIVSPANHLRLTALAGCGKTAVLVEYAKARSRQTWQYLAFNKAMATDASERFPSNTRAMTFHGWAWPQYGVDLAHKMDRPMDMARVAAKLSLPSSAPWLPGYMAVLSLALERFTRSAEALPDRTHIPPAEWGLWKQSDGARDALDIDQAVKHLETLWFHAQDPKSTLVPANPDTAIKRAQLARLAPRATGLLVDEAQDLSPAMLSWIRMADGPRVRAGDPYQTLYAWRSGGAGEWELPGEVGLSLACSHRFGPEVEPWVNPVLASLGCSFPLLGAGASTSIHHDPIENSHWVLGRSRASLLAEASRLQAQGIRVAWKGDRAWERLAQLKYLRDGDLDLVTDPMLTGFYDLEQFTEAAFEAGLDEWVAMAHQVLLGDIPLDASRFVHEKDAQVVLSTVHQVKGMSLDRVRILEDVFSNTTQPDELRVRYVALTRGMREISLPANARHDDLMPASKGPVDLHGDGF